MGYSAVIFGWMTILSTQTDVRPDTRVMTRNPKSNPNPTYTNLTCNLTPEHARQTL